MIVLHGTRETRGGNASDGSHTALIVFFGAQEKVCQDDEHCMMCILEFGDLFSFTFREDTFLFFSEGSGRERGTKGERERERGK